MDCLLLELVEPKYRYFYLPHQHHGDPRHCSNTDFDDTPLEMPPPILQWPAIKTQKTTKCNRHICNDSQGLISLPITTPSHKWKKKKKGDKSAIFFFCRRRGDGGHAHSNHSYNSIAENLWKLVVWWGYADSSSIGLAVEKTSSGEKHYNLRNDGATPINTNRIVWYLRSKVSKIVKERFIMTKESKMEN